MKHIIQALVENKFGVLARVASLFSARGYNIDSLAVGETQDPSVSCMTIVVNAEDERILEQITKQLNKLIEVITVIDFTRKEHIERELLLVKVAGEACEGAVGKLAKKYNLEVIQSGKDGCIVQMCLERHETEEVIKELKTVGSIQELIRSGRIAISK